MSSGGNLSEVTKFFIEKLKINANVERSFFFLLAFLLMNHLFACFLIFYGNRSFSPDSWIVVLGINSKSKSNYKKSSKKMNLN